MGTKRRRGAGIRKRTVKALNNFFKLEKVIPGKVFPKPEEPVTAEDPVTPNRSESVSEEPEPVSEEPKLTAVQKLAARKTDVSHIVKPGTQTSEPKIRHFGTQRDVRSGRRLRKRKTRRRRR
jgi:hypothetical protein